MNEDPPPVLPQSMTIQEYEILDVLGSGAFSYVYRTTKAGDPENYALKVIRKTSLSHAGDIERLQRELDTMTFLKHPSIVQMHNFFSDDNNFYLVLDYCPGGDLNDVIANSKQLREAQVASIFYQIVSALNYCHNKGVVHRDLKPQNILVTSFPYVKVADFGLCGFVVDDNKMKTFCGTPCYTAPEQLNRIQYDGRLADIWSLGVILYELSTGCHPWTVSNIPKMVKEISSGSYKVPNTVTPACEDLIKSILKVKPQDRLPLDKILAHPWMKLANSTARSIKPNGPPNLPPLQRATLHSITQSIDRKSLKSDHGIYSPFEGTPAGIDSSQRSPSPNMARSRSGNLPNRNSAQVRRASVGQSAGNFTATMKPQHIGALARASGAFGSTASLSSTSKPKKNPLPLPLPPTNDM